MKKLILISLITTALLIILSSVSNASTLINRVNGNRITSICIVLDDQSGEEGACAKVDVRAELDSGIVIKTFEKEKLAPDTYRHRRQTLGINIADRRKIRLIGFLFTPQVSRSKTVSAAIFYKVKTSLNLNE